MLFENKETVRTIWKKISSKTFIGEQPHSSLPLKFKFNDQDKLIAILLYFL